MISEKSSKLPESYNVSAYHVKLWNQIKIKSQLIWRAKSYEADVFQFLHDIGEIVFFKSKLIACSSPKNLAKLMGVFICPDIHELSLLSIVEKLKRPRRSILSSSLTHERIILFLSTLEHQFPGCSSSPQILELILEVLEDIGFLIKL